MKVILLIRFNLVFLRPAHHVKPHLLKPLPRKGLQSAAVFPSTHSAVTANVTLQSHISRSWTNKQKLLHSSGMLYFYTTTVSPVPIIVQQHSG